MILMFDVGNTELKMAIVDKDIIEKKYRFATNQNLSDDELYLNFYNIVKEYRFSHIVISSVVPNITYKLKSISRKHFFIEPLVLEQGVKTGLSIKADNPLEVGADIVACAVASERVFKNSLIVDLGTATKYIYVKNKTLAGVIIAPGMEISLQALTNSTALLPNIELKIPKSVLGNNTVSCMQSGIIYGSAAQIDGLIAKVKEEVKDDFKVILTGGLAELLLPVLKTEVVYKPDLVFEGLIDIFVKNR